MIAYLVALSPGLLISLSLTGAAVFLALLLSLLFSTICTLRTPILTFLITIYIRIFTGTPLLVQIFLIYYGPGQFAWLRAIPCLWQFLSQPWICAMLALTLNSAAYSTQLLTGAISAIPNGQWHSCAALGMNRLQSLRLLMPFAIKRVISSYSNEIIIVFKSTSLVYTITLMDVMGESQLLYGRTYDVMVFVAAGIIYLSVNIILILLMNYLERKALRFEQYRYIGQKFNS